MLKKSITYVDYNGEERTEDFYFNLNAAEMTELEMSVGGGFSEAIKKAVAMKDNPAIMAIFKKLILSAYGEKSADGRRFIKSEELSREFTQTEAYTELFIELCTDEEAAAAFVNAVVPTDKLNKLAAKQHA